MVACVLRIALFKLVRRHAWRARQSLIMQNCVLRIGGVDEHARL